MTDYLCPEYCITALISTLRSQADKYLDRSFKACGDDYEAAYNRALAETFLEYADSFDSVVCSVGMLVFQRQGHAEKEGELCSALEKLGNQRNKRVGELEGELSAHKIIVALLTDNIAFAVKNGRPFQSNVHADMAGAN